MSFHHQPPDFAGTNNNINYKLRNKKQRFITTIYQQTVQREEPASDGG